MTDNSPSTPKFQPCPNCGGQLGTSIANIPFILQGGQVVVIRRIPADVCQTCQEPYLFGDVTDMVLKLLNYIKRSPNEISVIDFAQISP